MNKDLLAAIGAALGHDGPYPVEVLAGTTDPERGIAAWVEEVNGEPAGDYDPVEITVNLAGPGLSPLRVPLATYNPYFGCDVHWMQLHGEASVTLYREKHRTIIARLASPGEQLLLPVGDDRVLDGDLFCYTQRAGGIGVLALGSFTPCLPLPVPPGARRAKLEVTSAPGGPVLRWAERVLLENSGHLPPSQRWRDGQVLHWRLPATSQTGFPADPARVWSRLRTALAGPDVPGVPDVPDVPPEGPDILIGAVTAPFWHAPSPAASYGELRGLEQRPPFWFPAAWYQYLSAAPSGRSAAAAWLAWLDRLAAQAPGQSAEAPGPEETDGWQPEWSVEDGAVHLALRQVQLHAGAIAEACRSGELPDSPWFRVLEDDWPYPAPREAFPPRFTAALARLPAEYRPA